MARSPQKKLPPADHNDPEAQAQIKDATTKIIAFEKQREAINASINKERKTIKALNVDLIAWAASKKRLAMDTDQRLEFDRSQSLCNAALGVPIQADLFGVGLNPAPDVEKPAPIGRIPNSLN